MAKKDLSEKIRLEEEKLAELKEKRAEIDKKIKKSEANLEKYYLTQNNERYIALQKATEQSGVSMADVLAALQSGDLIGLQERIEAAQQENQVVSDSGENYS